jgi:outer membrane protein OmpA-like peptidoglycan-associated protein
MFSQDEDDNQRVALGLIFGIVLLVVASVIGVGIHKSRPVAKAAPAVVTTALPAAVAVVDPTAASIKVENGVVTFYFATGKADLAPGANEALADVVKAVAAGKQATISGYHDATGDAATNEELSKQRAIAVRDAIKALGAPEDKLELKKPVQTQASGSNAEARRVEVTVH